MPLTIKRLLPERLLADQTVRAQFPPQMAREVDNDFAAPSGCLLIATQLEDDTAIVGMAGIRRVSRTVCEARRLVVAPSFQRQGVGRMLLSRLIHYAQSVGYEHMIVQFSSSVKPLEHFFRQMGFIERSTPEMPKDDAVLRHMTLSLLRSASG